MGLMEADLDSPESCETKTPARNFLPCLQTVLSLHKDFCVAQIMSLGVEVAQDSGTITVRALTRGARQPCAY